MLKISILYRRVSGVEIFQNSHYICKREYNVLLKNNKYPCRLIPSHISTYLQFLIVGVALHPAKPRLGGVTIP